MKSTPHNIWLLKRADQSAVAMFMLLVLAAAGGWWIAWGGLGNRLVEADGNAKQCTASFQVDINAADRGELIQLPGIGDILAQHIIETRKINGPFAELDELINVKGIGPKIMERFRPHLLPLQKDKNATSPR